MTAQKTNPNITIHPGGITHTHKPSKNITFNGTFLELLKQHELVDIQEKDEKEYFDCRFLDKNIGYFGVTINKDNQIVSIYIDYTSNIQTEMSIGTHSTPEEVIACFGTPNNTIIGHQFFRLCYDTTSPSNNHRDMAFEFSRNKEVRRIMVGELRLSENYWQRGDDEWDSLHDIPDSKFKDSPKKMYPLGFAMVKQQIATLKEKMDANTQSETSTPSEQEALQNTITLLEEIKTSEYDLLDVEFIIKDHFKKISLIVPETHKPTDNEFINALRTTILPLPTPNKETP